MTNKPRFKETSIAEVEDTDGNLLTFNGSRVGPRNWFDLRQASYGEGFVMPSMPQLVPFFYSALENKDIDTAQRVVETVRYLWLTGNTARLWGEEGVVVQDYPQVDDGVIVMDEKTLRGSLKKSGDGVYRSLNGLIRFAPYGFKVGEQSESDLERNKGLIATVGTEANAGLVARASIHYRSNPVLGGHWKAPENPVIDVPSVYINVPVKRLEVYSNGPRYANRCSFGVRSSVSTEDTK